MKKQVVVYLYNGRILIRKEDIVMKHNVISNQTSVFVKRNTYTKRINNWKSSSSNRFYCDHNNRIQIKPN